MSGIYIKGVQMPKDDWESIWIHPSGAVCYGGNFMLIKNAEAFAVPDHGDLFDADKLHHAMKVDAIKKLTFFDDGYLQYLKGLETVEDLLNEMPVIIPADKEET